MAAEKTKRVYEILADGKGSGPAGDGTYVVRFRKQGDADAFAKTATYYGRPTSVTTADVSTKLYRRWSDEGKLR